MLKNENLIWKFETPMYLCVGNNAKEPNKNQTTWKQK
jgi:hypothetical protein